MVTLAAGLFLALFFAVESDTVGHEGRFGANSSINTINYGQMGCSLFLLARYGMVKKRFKYSRIKGCFVMHYYECRAMVFARFYC